MPRNTTENTEEFFLYIINDGPLYSRTTYPKIQAIAVANRLRSPRSEALNAMGNELSKFFESRIDDWAINFNIAMRKLESDARWYSEKNDKLDLADELAHYYREFLAECWDKEQGHADRT